MLDFRYSGDSDNACPENRVSRIEITYFSRLNYIAIWHSDYFGYLF